ncbi:MAG: flagellin hook IN motif-containing protein [Planctomycetaceae bacterium]
MSGIGFHIASSVNVPSTRIAGPPLTSGTTSVSEATDRQREFLEISEFRSLLRRLPSKLNGTVRSGGTISRPPLISGNALGLNNSVTYTSVESVEQVNTTTTAFNPTQPEFSGSSTTQPTISGTYTGSVTDVYTVTAQASGAIGGLFADNFQVRDQGGNLLQTLTVPAFYFSGTELNLVNGLKIAFTSGTIQNGDSFQISVFANVDNKVSSANAFNGTGVNAPSFDPGLTVSNGTFTINGQSISVVSSDSIDSVLQKINQSTAGVTALFDSVRERIWIESNTAGSAGQIVFGSDTSGFLAAVKLDTAVVLNGIDADLQRHMADVVPLQGIQTGTFSINGTSLNNDSALDSLQDVLDRINASDADVNVRYELSSDRIRLTPGRSLSSLQLNDETSLLFSQLGLSTDLQEYPASISSTRTSLTKIAKVVQEFVQQINSLVAAADSREFEAELRTAFGDSFRELRPGHSVNATVGLRELGLDLAASGSDSFLTINEAKLKSALRQKGTTIHKLFHGAGTTRKGLLQNLDSRLNDRLQTLQQSAATNGTRLVDFRA